MRLRRRFWRVRVQWLFLSAIFLLGRNQLQPFPELPIVVQSIQSRALRLSSDHGIPSPQPSACPAWTLRLPSPRPRPSPLEITRRKLSWRCQKSDSSGTGGCNGPCDFAAFCMRQSAVEMSIVSQSEPWWYQRSHGQCYRDGIVTSGGAAREDGMLLASLRCTRVSLVTSTARMLYRAAKCLDSASACNDASFG